MQAQIVLPGFLPKSGGPLKMRKIWAVLDGQPAVISSQLGAIPMCMVLYIFCSTIVRIN